MRILVTGGAGYVGSHCVEELVKAKQEVFVFDNLSMGHQQAVDPKAVLIKGDLLDRLKVFRVMDEVRPEAVMHFAAKSLVGESMQKPMKYIGDNVVSAINLFEAMLKVGTKKFILSSTANLFDKPKKIPISEAEDIVPGSPYGESKNIIERQLYWLDKTQGVKYAALRYFNAAGASFSGRIGEDHKGETHLIPVVIETALGIRKKLTINGNDYPTPDGTCIRDYVHVTDLAAAHILSLAAIETKSRIYNLGCGRGYSIMEVIKKVEEETGKKVNYEFGPRRPGDPAKLVASSERIRKELNWKPKYGLGQIVETAVKWHKSHPKGFRQ
jgi:UDP-glucose 4-epimerase